MIPELSPDLVRRRLTSLFPASLIEAIARERRVIIRSGTIDITMLVWALVLGFAVGETRSIAEFQRAYTAATNQRLARSSFYERLTPKLTTVLNDLLAHALEEVVVPHTVAPHFDRFQDVLIADATIIRLQRFLATFPATHPDRSGVKLHLVHNLTKQTLETFKLTDERTQESTQFRTGNWVRGRLLLLDLGFYSYRRFALIDENEGFFLSRLKTNANPKIVTERREWRGRAIPLVGRHLQEVIGDLDREEIDVDVELKFKRRAYRGKRAMDTKQFRVVGVRNPDTNNYHLYITNLPEKFTPAQVAALYRARWEVELLFRELKSRYQLDNFRTSKPWMVELLVAAALLTLVVSRALLRMFQALADEETEFPTERWATTLRSFAQPILADLALDRGHPPPNIPTLMFGEARQPERSRVTLLQEIAEAFEIEVSP